MYEGRLDEDDLSVEHVLATYEKLNEGLQDGAGFSTEETLPDPKIIKMQRNLYKFSAAKSPAMLKEMNEMLYENGQMVSFEAFKAKADKLNIRYNKNWLKTEYRTARQSGYMAQKWEDIQNNTDLFPNLEYRTQGDDRVREEHQLLHGIVAPINHPFWEKYFPPNGFNCRCDAVQTAAPASEHIPETVDDVKPEFEMNIGIEGQVFKEDGDKHAFFALVEQSKDWAKRFELSKLEGGYNRIGTPKGNTVKVSIYADDVDLEENFRVATMSTDQLNHPLTIAPDIRINGRKNPEFIDSRDVKGDRVSPKWGNMRSATNNAFQDKLSKKKKGQLAEEKNAFLVIEANFDPTNANIELFTRQSWSKFNHYKTLDYIIIYRGDNILKLNRSIIESGFSMYSERINDLF